MFCSSVYLSYILYITDISLLKLNPGDSHARLIISKIYADMSEKLNI